MTRGEIRLWVGLAESSATRRAENRQPPSASRAAHSGQLNLPVLSDSTEAHAWASRHQPVLWRGLRRTCNPRAMACPRQTTANATTNSIAVGRLPEAAAWHGRCQREGLVAPQRLAAGRARTWCLLGNDDLDGVLLDEPSSVAEEMRLDESAIVVPVHLIILYVAGCAALTA